MRSIFNSSRKVGVALAAIAAMTPLTGNAQSGKSDVEVAYDTYVAKNMPGVSLDLVQAAAKEGQVVVYGLGLSQPMLDAFSKAFPFIKVEAILLSGGTLDERLQSERGAGAFKQDLVLAGEQTVDKALANNWCASYTPTSADAYKGAANVVPGKAYPWGATVIGIAYSADRLAPEDREAIKNATWDTLLDPRWKKYHWGLLNAGNGLSLSGSLPTYYLNKTFGEDFFERFIEVNGQPDIYTGGDQLSQAIVSGAIELAGPATIGAAYDFWKAGAPIAWTVPSPLLLGYDTGCILEGGPNPNAAKLLWEWVLSDAGQIVRQAPAAWTSQRADFDYASAVPQSLSSMDWYRTPNYGDVYEYDTDEVVKVASEQYLPRWHKLMEH